MVGYGCMNPLTTDDIHLLTDSIALVQYPKKVWHNEVTVDSFLYTNLIPSAPKVLLNVESGDFGIIENRSCGCRFEEYGYTEHVYNIRSFEKLTGEGVTFHGTRLIQIVEEILPAKFGGTSADYQVMEEEDEKSNTRLSILVHPDIGEIDEQALIQTIFSELNIGMESRRMMMEMWAQAGTLRVKRMPPVVTAAGKLLPLHINRSNKTDV